MLIINEHTHKHVLEEKHHNIKQQRRKYKAYDYICSDRVSYSFLVKINKI